MFADSRAEWLKSTASPTSSQLQPSRSLYYRIKSFSLLTMHNIWRAFAFCPFAWFLASAARRIDRFMWLVVDSPDHASNIKNVHKNVQQRINCTFSTLDTLLSARTGLGRSQRHYFYANLMFQLQSIDTKQKKPAELRVKRDEREKAKKKGR